jgi:hypothetical protein
VLSVTSKLVVFIELIFGFAGIAFIVAWINDPPGNYEPWILLFGIPTFIVDWIRRNGGFFLSVEGKKLAPTELVNHREEMRKHFQKEVREIRCNNLRSDVIIRHVRRVDSYPETNDQESGISPWFRVSLVDLYHKGILVALQIGTLVDGPDGYRFRDYSIGEEGTLRVYLIGKIPYDVIEAVNFDGDEYYHYPHVFCHFPFNGEPYEELVFSEKIDMGNGHFFFKDVATQKEVIENSKNWGGDFFS